MKRLVTILLFSLVISTGSIVSFSTYASAEVDLYLKAESFKWEELDNGSKLLEESGMIYGVGSLIRSDNRNAFNFKFKGELFGGSVDYDGQTQEGTPVKTDTDYFGFKLEGDSGYRFMIAEKSSLEPFVGLGLRWWKRDIQSTDEGIGYEETWSSFYVRAGIYGDHMISGQAKVFLEGGAKFPLYTRNEPDFSEFGLENPTLEPGSEVSLFAEAGLKWSKIKVAVFYEGMRFSESDLDDTYNAFYQPESKADMFGVNIGLSF